MSQLLTTPAESPERAIPSFVCSLTSLIGAEVSDVGSEPVAAGSIDEVPDSQSLTDPSQDDEMREEENVIDRTVSECPMKVPTR